MGEEFGVLPGMDTIFSALQLEKLVGFLRNKTQKNSLDVVIYDGISTEETIRLIGATGKSRFQISLSRFLPLYSCMYVCMMMYEMMMYLY